MHIRMVEEKVNCKKVGLKTRKRDSALSFPQLLSSHFIETYTKLKLGFPSLPLVNMKYIPSVITTEMVGLLRIVRS